jgi:hypothetical protein
MKFFKEDLTHHYSVKKCSKKESFKKNKRSHKTSAGGGSIKWFLQLK